jgi:hypothetical protein
VVESASACGNGPLQRPLRIVAHNLLYPLIPETYIGDELEALRRNGAEIVLSRDQPAVVPTASRIDVPLYESLDDAISAHDPDLVLAHWASTAMAARSRCIAARVPYAVRTHSFDWFVKNEVLLDPWCVGIWHLPHRYHPGPRVFALPTLIVESSVGAIPLGQRQRSVFSASAGLPKKAWSTLFDAMAQLPDVPMGIAVAQTNGFEWIPEHIAEIARGSQVECTLDVDMPYDEVQSRLAVHGALVYSIEPGEPIGQPRSVIEGALAGIPLVVPEHPGTRGLVGSCAHYFDAGDPASMAQAIRAALDAPASLSGRQELAARVRRRHAFPEVFEAWANSLTDAFVGWRRDNRGRALQQTSRFRFGAKTARP